MGVMWRHLVTSVLTVTLVLVWLMLMVAWFYQAMPEVDPFLQQGR